MVENYSQNLKRDQVDAREIDFEFERVGGFEKGGKSLFEAKFSDEKVCSMIIADYERCLTKMEVSPDIKSKISMPTNFEKLLLLGPGENQNAF